MFPSVNPHKLKWINATYPVVYTSGLYYYSLYLMQPYRISLWKSFGINWNLAWLEEEED